jgi:hypothetical protein
VGHWIYLVDAADDFEQDRRRGRFNPYLRIFGEKPKAQEIEGLDVALTALLCDAEEGILLIDEGDAAPELLQIITNVLYLGMPKTAKRVTRAMLGEKEEKEA